MDESKLDSMIRGTAVEGYARADPDGIVAEIGKLELLSDDGSPEMVADHLLHDLGKINPFYV